MHKKEEVTPAKINLAEKFALFQDTWSPKIIGQLNGQYVKLAKLHGEFVWHHHDNEDELFLVILGKLLIKFRDHEVTLQPGELLIVPAGVEHRQHNHCTNPLHTRSHLNI